MDETTTSMAQASGSGDWWRRNRLWLVGAVVLGALAFWLPYRDAVREFRDKREPSHPQDVAAGDFFWILAGFLCENNPRIFR